MKGFKGAKGKIVRKLGMNIYGNPKYDQILEKRPYGPGQHGVKKRRAKISEYGKQLFEKQKLKYCYGMAEKQFKAVFEKAKRQKGNTGSNLLVLLEKRLDNLVYRMGFAPTRASARQMISHNHIRVNGKKMNIPSFIVKKDDIVSVRDKDHSKNLAIRQIEENLWREVPSWIKANKENLSVSVVRIPEKEEIQSIANEQLIVEYYSR